MSYSRKTVAELDYIEFSYYLGTAVGAESSVFDSVKMANQLTVSGLVAQGKIKDPDPFVLTDDNAEFFAQSGAAAVQNAFGLMSQLSREIKNLIDVTVFNVANNSIKLLVGCKSTINDANLTIWDSAIRSYLVAYVLRDWYAIFAPENTAGLAEKAKILMDIAWSRSLSDMKWLVIGTVEEARISLEESMYEYISESLVTL